VDDPVASRTQAPATTRFGMDVATGSCMNRPTPSPSRERTAERSASRIHSFQRFTAVAGVLAGAVMGAATGAVVGVLAGPPGVWTGVLLGGLAGTAAGRAMYVQGSRASKHDAELDDEIGVTSHNLGRPPVEPVGRGSTGS
jgi:hypothetical protein